VPSIIYYYHNRIRRGDAWALDDCPFSSAKNPLLPCYIMVFEQTLKTVRVRRVELLFLNHFLYFYDNDGRKLAPNIVIILITYFCIVPDQSPHTKCAQYLSIIIIIIRNVMCAFILNRNNRTITQFKRVCLFVSLLLYRKQLPRPVCLHRFFSLNPAGRTPPNRPHSWLLFFITAMLRLKTALTCSMRRDITSLDDITSVILSRCTRRRFRHSA